MAPWAPLKHVLVALARFSGALGRSWGALGRSWGALGRSWRALGTLLGALGRLLDASWTQLAKNSKKNLFFKAQLGAQNPFKLAPKSSKNGCQNKHSF